MANSSGTSSSDDDGSSNGNLSRKRSVYSTNQGPNRSVVDYDNDDELREAMLSFINDADDMNSNSCSAQLTALLGEIHEGQPVQKVVRTQELQSELANGYDWVLPKHDPETTHPQILQEELQRLQVLKSYLIVDSQREEAFERITQLASRIFDVAVSTVTLVDLGRQFYMSNHGFEKFGIRDLRDLPRKFAFCAHTILSKNNVFVVNDLSKDFRFIDHPFVSGPPHVKFYAGAPLVTPEGYKIGTVCIIDTIARPNGLTEDECNTLTDLANMTLKVLVDRKYQLNKKKENPSQLLTYAAHDMMAPLTSVHLSLSILKNDATIQRSLGEHQKELLHTALSCSELLMRICNNTLEGLGQLDNQSSKVVPASNLLVSKGTNDKNVATTNMKDLVKRLQMTVDPIPKKVPCIVTLDKSVPNVIVGDDLKLFRCAVNLLTNAIDRTITGKVHLTIRWDGDTLLLFECEDCGPDIPVEEYQNLFQRGDADSKSHMGLLSIALLIDSLDGEYGLRPKDIDSDGNIIVDSTGHRRPGCLFWFSIPLILPEMLDKTSVLHPPQTSHVSSEPIPLAMSSEKNIPVPEQTMQYQGTAPVVGTTPYGNYASNITMNDQKRHNSLYAGNANFVSSQSETDPDIMDELGKLALDLNASLTDFEPFPVETDNDGGSNSMAKDIIRKRRALVIDDSIVVRRSLSQTLNHLGFDVVQAADGVEGMKELQQSLFDIVLCDFMMPVMDGVTCVAQYRNWEKTNRPWDSQLIIGISANTNINNNGQGLHAGMNAFLPKPITVKTLSDLDSSGEVVFRTRQLDEYANNTVQVNEYNNTKSSLSERNVPISMPPPQAPVHVSGRSTSASTQFSCLIATDGVRSNSDPLPQQLEAMGWNVAVVHDGIDCLEMLKYQTWSAVLVEDDLTQLSGMSCIAAFRKWEGLTRTDQQRNVYFVCDGDIPSPVDGESWIQPPIGFNGVLRKPVPWVDLQYMLLGEKGITSNFRSGGGDSTGSRPQGRGVWGL